MIEIDTGESTDLIYDFSGLPSHYYEEKCPHAGSKEIAGKVMDLLRTDGIDVKAVTRGLDHGSWSSFKVAFDSEENPLNVPIVRVSQFSSEDPHQHYRLGKAVSSLRSQDIQIIVSGMAVHNLGDLGLTMSNPRPMPYTITFDEALKEAATASPVEREQNMAGLLKRPDARKAHPTFEHLLPTYVGAGAAGTDVGQRLWTLKEGSVGWAQHQIGEVTVS